MLILLIFVFTCAIFIQNKTALANNEEVYLGGQPIGLNIFSTGLIVMDFKPIITKDGTCCPAKECGIQIGDMIIKAGNNDIKNPQDLEKSINNNFKKTQLSVFRDNTIIELEATPVFDPIAGSNKLGLIVKNDISGIGTLTYVDNNGNYCSLGHKICDPKLSNNHLYQNGNLFSATVIGVYKGTTNEAGALKGVFDKNTTPYGSITKNNEFGVYGKIKDTNIIKNTKRIKIGSKNEVKTGKAYIYTTIEGNIPSKYEIEIVKLYTQDKPEIKSMVIRVTDKRLIDASGGIVQGMSGSPIIQNDKLIGAVTHVFLNDSKIGYGVYIDWLI